MSETNQHKRLLQLKRRLLKTHGGIIVRRGCSKCGHGLLVFNGTNTGKCIWEDKEYQLTDEFVNEIRSLVN